MTMILLGSRAALRQGEIVKRLQHIRRPCVNQCGRHPDQAIVVNGAEKDLQKQSAYILNMF